MYVHVLFYADAVSLHVWGGVWVVLTYYPPSKKKKFFFVLELGYFIVLVNGQTHREAGTSVNCLTLHLVSALGYATLRASNFPFSPNRIGIWGLR